jgi:hypothetical protein
LAIFTSAGLIIQPTPSGRVATTTSFWSVASAFLTLLERAVIW